MKKPKTYPEPLRRIVWAIDPNPDKSVLKRSAVLIEALTRGAKCVVEPVCVITPPNPYIERRGFLALLSDNEGEVRERLKALLRGARVKGLTAPKLLIEHEFSKRGAIRKLTDHARKTKADVIVANTHARRGVARAVMGSFAETLILNSPIPVLVTSTKARVASRIGGILFPTDLCKESLKVFPSVLALAARLKARLFIYHKVEIFSEYATFAYTGTPIYAGYLKEDIARRTKQAETLRARAEEAGVKAEVIVDRGKYFVEDGILKTAKRKKAGLIAMASESGPVASALLGSATRETIRTANISVWVLHPGGKRRKVTKSPVRKPLEVPEELAPGIR